MAPPPSKKPKLSQMFRPVYEQTWPGVIKSSRKGGEFAFCSVCGLDFKISHGGSNDISKHLATQKHKSNVSDKSKSVGMDCFVVKKKSENSAVRAESLFVKFLVEHNIPFSVSDHASDLFKKMFPDSEVAKQYACGRTKTTAISNYFGAECSSQLVKKLKGKPFSLSTDGSNDMGSETLYPIVIRYFNDDIGKVTSELLCISACKTSSTGENIFNLLHKELEERGLSWKYCISFGCDNAGVMVGIHKGVAAFIKKFNPDLQVQGCPCHLLHIAAKNGAKQLSVDVESILIDLYHYFEKSTKRQQEFIGLLQETGTVVRKIMKHGPTRWLSLDTCINRLLEQWDALCIYFKSHEEKSDRFKRLQSFFAAPLSKAYCFFLQKALPVFVNANAFLQREDPQLHNMQKKLLDVLTTVAVRFIKSKVISACKNLLTLDFSNKELHKHREDVTIGQSCREYMDHLQNEKLITSSKESQFYNDVRRFYSESAKYICTKLPVDSELLAHAGVLLPANRLDFDFSSIKMFIQKMPIIKPETTSMDDLEEQFLLYQLDSLSDSILESRVDEAWVAIGKIKNMDGLSKYGKLADIMLAITVIPHTNAECERVFSMVKKCKTEFRSRLSTAVLSNLIVQKLHMQAREQTCHQCTFTDEQLAQAKSACYSSRK